MTAAQHNTVLDYTQRWKNDVRLPTYTQLYGRNEESKRRVADWYTEAGMLMRPKPGNIF